MTKLERDLLNAIVNDSRRPTIEHAEYSFGPGGVGRVEVVSVSEAAHLFKSPDFVTGWDMCHAHMRGRLADLISLSPKDLRTMLRGLSFNG